jgi:hydroxylamine reductase (hybrid-cluster protein)
MGIKTLFIFEMLGKPAEHIKNSLGEYIDKIGQNKGITLNKKIVHEPKPLEKEHKGFFTTFAEVEIITENLEGLFNIVLNTLPSHIEIIEPDVISLRNFDLNSVLNELTVKLHRYDEVAKILAIDKNNLINQVRELEERLKNLSCEKKIDKKDENKEVKSKDKKEIKNRKSKGKIKS